MATTQPHQNCLIIFYKNPIQGHVKTRLAATIGHPKALFIYQKLVEKTCHEAQKVEGRKVVYYSSSVDESDIWSDSAFEKKVQYGDDLGSRMLQAFTDEQNASKIIIIGTDCYEISSELIQIAFNQLNHHDAVIGPAKDGGYYLLGTKKLLKGLFENMPWSTSQLCQLTIKYLQENHLSYYLLPSLSDVDREEDLGELGKYL